MQRRGRLQKVEVGGRQRVAEPRPEHPTAVASHAGSALLVAVRTRRG
jgi:hypothetical protein